MNERQVKKLPIIDYETMSDIMYLESEYKEREIRKNGKH